MDVHVSKYFIFAEILVFFFTLFYATMANKMCSHLALGFITVLLFFASCATPSIKPQLIGTFTLVDMQPVLKENNVLDEEGKKHIDHSKSINLNVTTMTFNEDGTFKRVFPHPQNQQRLTWDGTYTVNEKMKTINIKVQIGKKKGNFDFEIKELKNGMLHLIGPYGKIKMNYIYQK